MPARRPAHGAYRAGPGIRERYLQLFLTTVPQLVAKVGTAVEARDAVGLKRAAHTLKGACGSAGAEEMARLGSELEQAAARGELEAADGLWPQLENSLIRASDYVRTV